MNQDVSVLLSALDKINNSNLISVFIPTLDREVKFKLLTAAQHKHILTTIMEQNNSGLSLSILLNQIINDNSTEQINYNILDKNYILVSLRTYSLSNLYKSNNNNEQIDLINVLKNKNSINITSPISVIENLFKINISSPTLNKDIQINLNSKRKIESIRDESQEKIAKVALDEIYTNEFIKYIDSIEYNNVIIQFSDLNNNQKRQIVDNLPSTTSKLLSDKINEYKEMSETFLKIGDQKISINFDQAFFTI